MRVSAKRHRVLAALTLPFAVLLWPGAPSGARATVSPPPVYRRARREPCL